jgi:hypothetical protein
MYIVVTLFQRVRKKNGSYRSKLGGLGGALYHWQSIAIRFDLPDVDMEIRSNGLEAIKAVGRFEYKLTTNIAQYNIISVLHQIIKGMEKRLIFDYIKGHQDEVTEELNQ